MNWDAIATVAEVASAIAVVVSLIYLALQVRQNTVAQQGSTHHQFLSTQTTANQLIGGSAEVCELIEKANEDFASITSAERFRLLFIYYDHFNQWEFAFDSRENALMGPNVWNKIDSGYALVAELTPSFRDTWAIIKGSFPHEFGEHVDNVIAENKMSRLGNDENAI
jgi:hypothetical protein